MIVTVLGAMLCTTLLLASRFPRTVPREPAAARPRADSRLTLHARWTHWPRFRRSTDVTPTSLAQWADDLARSLRHGATLRGALRSVAPADEGLAREAAMLRHLIDRGATVSDACHAWMQLPAPARPHEAQPVETLAAVLAATATVGGPAAAPLDRFAAAMRQRASEQLERRAHSAQATMSARVLTAIPLAVLALLLVVDADVRAVVIRPSGALVVTAGMALNLAGALWMRKIVGQHATTGRP